MSIIYSCPSSFKIKYANMFQIICSIVLVIMKESHPRVGRRKGKKVVIRTEIEIGRRRRTRTRTRTEKEKEKEKGIVVKVGTGKETGRKTVIDIIEIVTGIAVENAVKEEGVEMMTMMIIIEAGIMIGTDRR